MKLFSCCFSYERNCPRAQNKFISLFLSVSLSCKRVSGESSRKHCYYDFTYNYLISGVAAGRALRNVVHQFWKWISFTAVMKDTKWKQRNAKGQIFEVNKLHLVDCSIRCASKWLNVVPKLAYTHTHEQFALSHTYCRQNNCLFAAEN